MKYEVKLRSRLMLERALTLDGADCDPDDYDFDVSELQNSDDWLETSSILTDEAGTELVFTGENGAETAVSLSVESPVVGTAKTADDEEPLKESTFVRCLYWQNQERPYENEEGESTLEADGIEPGKITVSYKMVRDENNELVPVLYCVEFDGEYMEFGTEEGDGYDARQTII